MRKILYIAVCFTVLSCGQKKEQDFYAIQDNGFKKSYQRGEVLYNDMCITCHLANGEGVPKAFPPLAGSDYLKNNQEASIKSVKYGMSGEITVNGVTYNSVMAKMGLSDEEVADVMNYINNSWGNKYGSILTAEKVTKITP
jgi:mono/diheme cytochrome c family protein